MTCVVCGATAISSPGEGFAFYRAARVPEVDAGEYNLAEVTLCDGCAIDKGLLSTGNQL